MRVQPVSLLPLLLALASCGDDAGRRIFVNSGSICLTPAQGQIDAVVSLEQCLSTSCNRLVAGACTLRELDGIITLTSRIVIEPTGDQVCTDDCGTWAGGCRMPEPPAGDYAFNFGAVQTTLSFPLAGPSTLIPDGGLDSCSAPVP